VCFVSSSCSAYLLHVNKLPLLENARCERVQACADDDRDLHGTDPQFMFTRTVAPPSCFEERE